MYKLKEEVNQINAYYSEDIAAKSIVGITAIILASDFSSAIKGMGIE